MTGLPPSLPMISLANGKMCDLSEFVIDKYDNCNLYPFLTGNLMYNIYLKSGVLCALTVSSLKLNLTEEISSGIIFLCPNFAAKKWSKSWSAHLVVRCQLCWHCCKHTQVPRWVQNYHHFQMGKWANGQMGKCKTCTEKRGKPGCTGQWWVAALKMGTNWKCSRRLVYHSVPPTLHPSTVQLLLKEAFWLVDNLLSTVLEDDEIYGEQMKLSPPTLVANLPPKKLPI